MRQRIHRSVYLFLLALLAVAMTTSVFLMNLVWVLLLVNWIAEWNWKGKVSEFCNNTFLHAILVLMAVHLIWTFVGDNWTEGFDDLRRKLPLLVIPVVMLTSPALSRNERSSVLGVYVFTVLVVSFIGLGRYLTIPDLPYREIVPYISHIRFGLNVCLSIVLLLFVATRATRAVRLLVVLAILWLLVFLMLIQSYTSFIILVCVTVALLFLSWKRLAPLSRTLVVSVLLLLTLSLSGCFGKLVYDYYNMSPLATQPLKTCTVNGNPYSHARDGFVENGNYVNDYVCEEELRAEWPKHSAVHLDSITPVGYTVYPALIRYLNAKGLTKDSVGVSHLSELDIAAIERGVGNPVYLHQGSPRKMVYTLLFEYENFRHYNSVRNFSMLQRFELWRNALATSASHLLLGVGTGDVVDATQATMKQRGSPLFGYEKYPHSQYLSLLVTFGIVGTLLIIFFFVRAWRTTPCAKSLLFVSFSTIFLVSCLSEDTLQTLAGVVFFAMFYSLFSRPCLDDSQGIG